jgi:hypothetical protein
MLEIGRRYYDCNSDGNIVGSTQNFLGRSVESIGQQSPRAVFRLLSRLSTTMGVCAIVKNDLGIVSGRLMQ